MEGLLTIVLGLVIFLVLMFSGIFSRRGAWTNAFQDVAQRYGGWFSPAGVFRRPAATFTYKEIPCQVRCRTHRRTGLRAETEFTISWPIQRMKMQILKTSGDFARRRLRGLNRIEIDDPTFAEQFEIYASNQTVLTSAVGDRDKWQVQKVANDDLVRRLLSSGVKWQIQQLADFLQDQTVFISIHKGSLRVVKPGFIKTSQLLDDFVRYSLELFDQLLLTLNDGIEFKDEHMVSAFEVMQCPVCSCDVEGQMVICVRCKTPHCLDCWQYNGTCGMFACGETRFISIGASSAKIDHS